MSLLFPDHVRVGLGATYAVLAKVNGAKVSHWRMQTWDASTTATAWEQGLTAISGWLAELKSLNNNSSRKINVSLALSSELAPLQLLPWHEEITRNEQQALLAKANFRRIYGDMTENWQVVAQPSGYGQPWIASAIDKRLLEAIKARLIGGKLISAMPLSLSLFNAVQNQLPSQPCWLLVPELENLTAIHCRDGQLKLLQRLPIASIEQDSVKDLLVREARLAGLTELPAKIYVASVKSDLKEVSVINLGWKSGESSLSNKNALKDCPFHLLGGRP